MSYLQLPKEADVYHCYLDYLMGTHHVILFNLVFRLKHLEIFNSANYEREQTVTALQGPFQSAEQFFYVGTFTGLAI